MIRPFDGYSRAVPEATVVHGCKEAEDIAARRVAEQAMLGNTGKIIYFTGGAKLWGGGLKQLLALYLIPKVSRAMRNKPPKKNAVEAMRGAEVFCSELIKLGGNPNDFDIRVSPKGKHIKGNIEGILEHPEWGFESHKSIGFMTLPPESLRAIGSFHIVCPNSTAVSIPMPFWLDEIGIGKHLYDRGELSWVNKRIVDWQLETEFKKVGLPNAQEPDYCKRGFYLPPDMEKEMAAAAELAAIRPAIRNPYRNFFEELRAAA
ncbi:MAG: hypothetical protein WDO70_09945 [Alphaproteobacteria bacterium]